MKNLVYEAWIDLQHPEVVWELGVLAAALAVAWLVNRLARFDRIEASGVWKFGVGGLKRILAPLVALIIVVIAREILRRHVLVSVDVLHLAVPLLGSLALVRVFFYALRHVFPPGGVLEKLERTLAVAVWLVFALYVVGALPAVVAALDAAAITLGKQRVSAWLVLQALFWTSVTVLAALWSGSALEARLMRSDGMHYSLRVALARVSKALLVLVALLVVLPLVGIDITVLSVFGGALGVGLGFGLQKVASNYVSGFIVLLERSISVGDMITADHFYGKVREITSRYVLVQSQDGREAIIPNEIVVGTTVLNHTYTDRNMLVACAVSIAYGTDLDRAMSILREVAVAHPRVLKQPEPGALVLRFGDSGIDLELGFWIGDPDKGTGNVRSDVNVAIWRAFRDAGIEIPYPRRVIQITGDGSAATR
jgi:small-conductance mechanosensitive channel